MNQSDKAKTSRQGLTTFGVLSNHGKLRGAEVAYRRAVALEPKNLIAQSGLGNTLGQRGKLKEAEEVCRRAVALIPVYTAKHGKDDSLFSSIHDNLGNAYYGQREFNQAVTEFRRAIALDPRNVGPYLNLGAALGLQKKFSESEAASRKALELDPGNARALRNLDAVLRAQGKSR